MTYAIDDRLLIKRSLARRLVDLQFPQWRGLTLQPVQMNGWDNVTFRLGNQMKARFPTARRYVPQIQKQHLWLPHMAAFLKVQIPTPVAVGTSADEYPFPWAIETWIEGEVPSAENVPDRKSFAAELGKFLLSLQQIPPAAGPLPGEDNFFRGGSLQVYDSETRECIERLENELDGGTATAIWEAALMSSFDAAACWVHGDFAPGNLLVADGHLKAVIDFGCSAVGDPACDLVIAWTFFEGESRDVFRSTIGAQRGMWARARGWALWKTVLQLSAQIDQRSRNQSICTKLHHLIDDLISDYRQENKVS
jgi:aminoglycoside phosphotransferase (APT) family kinase protein